MMTRLILGLLLGNLMVGPNVFAEETETQSSDFKKDENNDNSDEQEEKTDNLETVAASDSKNQSVEANSASIMEVNENSPDTEMLSLLAANISLDRMGGLHQRD